MEMFHSSNMKNEGLFSLGHCRSVTFAKRFYGVVSLLLMSMFAELRKLLFMCYLAFVPNKPLC